MYQQGLVILSSLNKLQTSVSVDSLFVGGVKVSSPGSIGLKLYPLLLDYQAQHPHLLIEYAFAPNQQIEWNITECRYDLGIMSQLSRLDT